MKIPAKIFKMHAKTYEQGSSKIFAENREDLGQNFWNTEKEKDREKEKVGGRPAKLNEKKGRQRFRARDKKNTGDIFLLEGQVSRCSRAKQQQRNVQKKCAARAKLFFFAN